jgi:hypothetical protein
MLILVNGTKQVNTPPPPPSPINTLKILYLFTVDLKTLPVTKGCRAWNDLMIVNNEFQLKWKEAVVV